MLELIQIPYSPFCIVQRRILEYPASSQSHQHSTGDRSLVWKLTKQRYYQVPILKDGKEVIFETEDGSNYREISRSKARARIVSAQMEGLQDVLWNYFENDIEGLTFKLNDIHWKEVIPDNDRLRFVRHKERKFGLGCLDKWGEQEKTLLGTVGEEINSVRRKSFLEREYLLEDRRASFYFDLFGMLGNLLYSGHYKLPARHKRLVKLYDRMA